MRKLFLLLSMALTFTSLNAQIFNVTDPQLVIKAENNTFFMNPVYSNDGSKIAFTGSNYKGIYLFDLNSKNISQVTDEDAAGYAFKWSADSKNILSRPARFDNEGRRFNAVKLYNTETKEAKLLSDYTTQAGSLPEFTNNFDAAYFIQNKNLEIKPTGILLSKAVSNDASFIYFDFDKVVVENRSNNTVKTIANFEGFTLLNLTVSNDKKKIAFEVMGGSLYLVNVDGSGLTEIGLGYRPKWSADGNYLTYMVTKDDGQIFTESDIYVYDVVRGLKQNITDSRDQLEMSPSFSPDGKSIIFENFNDGSIYSINITAK